MKEIGIREAYNINGRFIDICESIRSQSEFTTEYILDDDDYLAARFIHFDDEYIVTVLSVNATQYEVQCGRYWKHCTIDALETEFYTVVGRYITGR